MRFTNTIAAILCAFTIFAVGVFVGAEILDKGTERKVEPPSPAKPAITDNAGDICVPKGNWIICVPREMVERELRQFSGDACFDGTGNQVPCGKDPREEQQ